MFESIKKMLGGGSQDLKQAIEKGAVIIDVRSRSEYSAGHVTGSINLPLDTLSMHLGKLDKTKPVITCCASGMRSASAKTFLLKNGFSEVYNAGPWQNILKYLP